MTAIWEFLSSAANQETLAWIGGGLAVVASGLWVVVKHFTAQPASKPSAAPPPQLTAGRDIRVGDVVLPRLALGLAALGMLLLVLTLILRPGDSVTNSATAGGDIRDSTISITGADTTPD